MPFLFTLAAFGTIDWFVLGAYLAAMLGVGLHAAWKERRHKSGTAEFFLGEAQKI